MSKDVKKITLGGVISWIFGIVFILISFGNFLESSFIAGSIFLIIAIAVLPPSRKFIKEKVNFDLLGQLSRLLKHLVPYLKNIKLNIKRNHKMEKIEKKKPNYRSLIVSLILIVIIAIFFISCFNSVGSSKSGAYYKCLSKAKQCSEGIPAVQMEFMKSCRDIYYYTANTTELIDFTRGMC